MDVRDRIGFKAAAGEKLAAASYNPRLLALIHAGVLLGVGLVIALLDYYLGYHVEVSGGLSGMGMRSVLGTVRMTLQYMLQIVTPFWSIGFTFVALQMARGKQVGPKSLLEGFRRFGSVLRLRLVEGLMYMGAAIACAYAASFLFMFTPYAEPMIEEILPVIEAGSTVQEAQEAFMQIPAQTLEKMMVPFVVMAAVIFLPVMGLLFYRFRVADFIVMDQPKIGGLVATIISSRMTRRRRWQLFKMDASFWWYYGVMLLALVVSYGDVILKWMGVALPFSDPAAWILFYIAGILLQLAVCWYGQSYVQTTWAVVYEQLRQAPMVPQVPRAPQATQNLPWDDTYQQMEQ